MRLTYQILGIPCWRLKCNSSIFNYLVLENKIPFFLSVYNCPLLIDHVPTALRRFNALYVLFRG